MGQEGMDLGGVPALGGLQVSDAVAKVQYLGYEDHTKADKHGAPGVWMEFVITEGRDPSDGSRIDGGSFKYLMFLPIATNATRAKQCAGNIVNLCKSADVKPGRLPTDSVEACMGQVAKWLDKKTLYVIRKGGDKDRGVFAENSFVTKGLFLARYNAIDDQLAKKAATPDKTDKTPAGVKLDGIDLEPDTNTGSGQGDALDGM